MMMTNKLTVMADSVNRLMVRSR